MNSSKLAETLLMISVTDSELIRSKSQRSRSRVHVTLTVTYTDVSYKSTY